MLPAGRCCHCHCFLNETPLCLRLLSISQPSTQQFSFLFSASHMVSIWYPLYFRHCASGSSLAASRGPQGAHSVTAHWTVSRHSLSTKAEARPEAIGKSHSCLFCCLCWVPVCSLPTSSSSHPAPPQTCVKQHDTTLAHAGHGGPPVSLT